MLNVKMCGRVLRLINLCQANFADHKQH